MVPVSDEYLRIPHQPVQHTQSPRILQLPQTQRIPSRHRRHLQRRPTRNGTNYPAHRVPDIVLKHHQQRTQRRPRRPHHRHPILHPWTSRLLVRKNDPPVILLQPHRRNKPRAASAPRLRTRTTPQSHRPMAPHPASKHRPPPTVFAYPLRNHTDPHPHAAPTPTARYCAPNEPTTPCSTSAVIASNGGER